MELKCHVTEPQFAAELEKILDKLSKLYTISTYHFLEVFKSMPSNIRMGLFSTAANRESYEGTDLEDIADYATEVVFWYRCESAKINPADKPFTLRNPDDLKQFEEFLDRMLHLMSISQYHFLIYLEMCPLAYWDKIDDLRETSYKLQRDSVEYLRCLEKCKKLSFSYSDSIDLLLMEEDEEIEDNYYQEDEY